MTKTANEGGNWLTRVCLEMETCKYFNTGIMIHIISLIKPLFTDTCIHCVIVYNMMLSQ